MKKIILFLSGLILIFIFISCGSAEVNTGIAGQETVKSASGDTSQAGQPQPTATAQAKEEETQASEQENEQPVNNDTIAVIGKYILTREKYKTITEYMNEKYDYTLTPEQEKEFLDFIINKKLMAMDAREKGYDKRKDIMTKYEWDYDDLLSHAYYVENIESKSKVTDKEAKDYYTKHAEDFVQVKAAHILVKDKDEAMSLYKRIQGGENFADIAKKYSTDTSTKDSGGELGFFSKGTMVKEFEDAAFSMSKDELSEPVQTVYGYHLIKVEDKKNFSFDESKDKIINLIESAKKQELFDKLMEKLKAKYGVTVHGTKVK